MNKEQLVHQVSNLMRDNGVRKPIRAQKKVIHITDDEGNRKDFYIKRKDTDVAYTVDDVKSVIDACICVIEDCLKHGESVSVHGFGSIGIHYRKPRATKHPKTGEDVEVCGRYLPKFSFGNDLRMCAKIYELSLNDNLCELPPIEDDENDEA